MDNILVFPCGSEIGLEIHRSLYGLKNVNIYGASSVDDHGKFVYKNYISGLPKVNQKNFIKVLNKVVKEFKIDYIFPAHDDVVLNLSQNKKMISCKIISSPLKTCQICRSKLKTYKYFKNIIPVPKIFDNISLVKKDDYPIYLKPDKGQGSKNNYLAYNFEELTFYTQKYSELIALEFLPGNEYTVDCFTDLKGKLLFSKARIRSRISNGISVNTKRIEDNQISKIAEKINQHIELNGAWFFQLKRNSENKLMLLEIAPRIAGSMSLYRILGVNFPQLSYLNTKGERVEILFNDKDIQLDRALENKYKIDINYKHLYVDLDDCLIMNNQVNIKLIQLIYQCINNKIKIHLISKHKGNIEDTLQKFKLHSLFDSIKVITMEDQKTKYIKNKNSIFIDDSFCERKSVSEQMKIPTFSLDAIDCLLE